MTKRTEIISKIRDIRWDLADKSDLQALMLLGAYAADEFAESLRVAVKKHPLIFEKMAEGELNTTNIAFGDYTGPGDHSAYLWHFIRKYKVEQKCSRLIREAGEDYVRFVRRLPERVRIMSVVSREQELPDIFTSMLRSKSWCELPELQAFHHYLVEHIRLDSGDDGHASLLSSFVVSDDVTPFWEKRLEMYSPVESVIFFRTFNTL